MNITDPIADMLTRIRNANSSKHKTVDIPASNMKLGIAEILFKEGYIKWLKAVAKKSSWNLQLAPVTSTPLPRTSARRLKNWK